MKRILLFSLFIACILLLSSCAQSYYALSPEKTTYIASNNLNDINLHYRYDILNESGNRKLSKKEKKQNIKIVAVKIINNTDHIINIGNNAAFFSGNTLIYPMDAISIRNNIKQSVPSYLWYLLLSPLTFSFNGSDPAPIGLLLGPGIAGGNMLVAGTANKSFYNELTKYDILNRDIQVGETVYGIVGFRDLDYVPLSIRLIE
ncbi:MAG: hypothetical protein PHH37_06135 [Paludibacter sp.]|nr:hypothetical protein [Paludibacter sp.]